MWFPSDLYFAHSLRDYNTPRSRQALVQIARLCPHSTIHNPEDFDGEFKRVADRIGWVPAYKQILTERVLDGGVVVLEHQDHIGRGVYEEVRISLTELKIPAWVLRAGVLVPVESVELAEADDWRVHYGKIVVRGVRDGASRVSSVPVCGTGSDCGHPGGGMGQGLTG